MRNIFNDKNIGKTVKDLPENFTWNDLFQIAVGIPEGTQNFFKRYFQLPNLVTARSSPAPPSQDAEEWLIDKSKDKPTGERYSFDEVVQFLQEYASLSHTGDEDELWEEIRVIFRDWREYDNSIRESIKELKSKYKVYKK